MSLESQVSNSPRHPFTKVSQLAKDLCFRAILAFTPGATPISQPKESEEPKVNRNDNPVRNAPDGPGRGRLFEEAVDDVQQR